MNKKIAIIISFGVIAVLALSIIIMSVVSVNYRPDIKDPNQIQIVDSNNVNVTFSSDNENYEKIIEEFTNSFTRGFLSALFAGQTQGITKATQVSSYPAIEGYKIVFSYAAPQTLKVNNEVQKYNYKQIIFEVSDAKNFNEINLYFSHYGAEKPQYYQVKTFANQEKLFALLESFELGNLGH